MKRYVSAFLTLAAVCLVLAAASSARADDCIAFGGTPVGADCNVSNTTAIQTVNKTFSFNGTLTFLANGVRQVAANTSLTLNVGGDFIMEDKSKIRCAR